MHLRIELLGRRSGGVGPGHVHVGRQVVGAVDGVPFVAAGGPRQSGTEGGQEVVQGPGHDGVVIEGNVQGNDADGKAYAYERERTGREYKTQRDGEREGEGGKKKKRASKERWKMRK